MSARGGRRDGPVAFVGSSRTHGGAERQLALIVEAVAAREPVVVLLGDGSSEDTRAAMAAAGARVLLVPGLERRPTPAGIARTFAALRRLRPRLVHVNLSDQGDGLAGVAAARLARLPTLATLHLVLPGRRRVLEALSRTVLRMAEPVIAVSDGVGAHLEAAGVTHRVVRNALPEPSSPARGRSDLLPDSSGPLVGGIGRLDRQKGWDVLCAAAPAVRDAVGDISFVVLGDGPERETLHAAGAGAGVRFLGHVEDAASYLPAFDVLVMPSRYEGLSLTALEALAHGVPVVASDIPGLREAVEGCGALVAPEDPAALAAAVAGLLESPERRRAASAAARERSRTVFGLERMIRLTCEVQALATAAPRATVRRRLRETGRPSH